MINLIALLIGRRQYDTNAHPTFTNYIYAYNLLRNRAPLGQTQQSTQALPEQGKFDGLYGGN